MAGKLIGIMFHSRNLSHIAHLQAKGDGSLAKHMALGSFYDGIVSLSDKFAEMYQGRHGIIKDIPIMTAEGGDITATLESHMKLIEKTRYTECDKEDSPLQNVLDEIVGIYLSTLYKLKTLK